MDKHDIPVPDENLAIYSLLYGIEVGLREFVIEILNAECGGQWWKQRVPEDVRDAVREALEDERSVKWCRLVPHHPIYYASFPDLKKIIERADNWRDVFRKVFRRKDILIATLSELEPIRNKIAHNRKATAEDVSVVRGAHAKIVTAIGEDRFRLLVARCTVAEDIPSRLSDLRSEAESTFTCCKACNPLQELEIWPKVDASWWFAPDYLGRELDAIRLYFETVLAYAKLPRPRGSGYKIEAWLRSNDLDGKYLAAIEQLAILLDDAEGT